METTNILVVPVGLDVGSRCVRVATGRSVPIETLLERASKAAAALTTTSASSSPPSSPSDATTTTTTTSNELDDLWPTLVVNADGQRWTRAVVARAAKSAEEDNVQHDEEHDHLWGDAAAATISTDATASGGWIRELLLQQAAAAAAVSNTNTTSNTVGASEEEDEEDEANKNATTTSSADNNNNSQSWTNAFFSHVMSSHIPQFQTAAAAAAGTATPSAAAAANAVTTTFAVVASVPPSSTNNNDSNNNAPQPSEQYLAYLTQSIQHALNKTKRRQRKKMPLTSSVIGVIADPVAIALAYSYYQYKSLMESNTTTTTSNSNNSNKNLLVLDGGASGLTWTWLQQAPSPLSSTTSSSSSSSTSSSPASLLLSQLWCLQQSRTSEQVSTRALVTAMAKHVSEQLEQQHRLERNSATHNKRAWYKLQHACEQQVLSRLLSPPSGSSGSSSATRNWTVHMDGWYQGLDCHVVVSAPRLDHVLSPMQQQTKRMVLEALEYIQQQQQSTTTTTTEEDQVVTVLLAGSLHAWMKPLVEGVVRQWNTTTTSTTTTTPGNKMRVQLSTFATPQQVPPEEMVAMGCALQAQWILTKAAASLLRSSNAATHHVAPPLFLQPRMRVWKSPITIAISHSNHSNSNNSNNASAATTQNGNHHHHSQEDNMMVLITRHSTWLPCHLTHALRPSTNANEATSSAMITWTLWQLKSSHGDGNAATAAAASTTPKALAQLELPPPTKDNDYSLTLFLSEQGTLHMSLSGSDQVVTLAPILDGSSGDEGDDDDDDEEEDDHDLD